MDQRLHRALHLGPLGRHHLLVVGHVGALPLRRHQLLAALHHDLHRLAHLLHADAVAVVVVAVLADRDVEIELGIALVGLRLAQVPGRARAAQHHAREAPACMQSSRLTTPMSTLRCLKMRLSVSRPSMSSSTLGCVLAELGDVLDELRRQVLVHAAEAEVLGVHAAARGALVEHHQLLALLEAPQRRGERADVHGLGGDVEEVRQQAADLGVEHADELGALRHLELQQLLAGKAEGVLLVHRRHVVEPVEVADGLHVGLVLDQLLGAAVQQTDVRDRRGSPPRRRAPAPGAARRAPPDAAGRS